MAHFAFHMGPWCASGGVSACAISWRIVFSIAAMLETSAKGHESVINRARYLQHPYRRLALSH